MVATSRVVVVGGVIAAAVVVIRAFWARNKRVRFAGVEGGGTTWRVAIAEGTPTNIVESAVFDTTTPEETLRKVKTWLDSHKFDALGIASFGPVDLHPSSKTYGYITTTPKPGWKFVDVVGPLSAGLSPRIPVAFDTDVNAPAMAEFKYRRNKSETSCVYVTVGTGVGVGLVINGKCVHGLLHPEGGHLCVPRHPNDTAETVNPDAPFGGINVECFTNAEALARRAGLRDRRELESVGDDHVVWELASHYLASLCANMVLLVSPERIVLSGGVLARKVVFPMVRQKTQAFLNGYINMPAITTSAIEEYIVPSAFGSRAGLVGACVLAENALNGL